MPVAKVWQPGEIRLCKKCGTSKPVEQFVWMGKPSGHRYPTYCKECWRADVKRRKAALPIDERRLRERMKVVRRYGLTEEEFAEMKAAAAGRCQICGEPERPIIHDGGKQRDLAIDHDHVTGRVRGFLCWICNTRLGWLERVGVKNVLSYLTKDHQ